MQKLQSTEFLYTHSNSCILSLFILPAVHINLDCMFWSAEWKQRTPPFDFGAHSASGVRRPQTTNRYDVGNFSFQILKDISFTCYVDEKLDYVEKSSILLFEFKHIPNLITT